MKTAVLGGIVIGVFVVNWLGVFVLPIAVAIYQCIALLFLMTWRGVDPLSLKKFRSPYSELLYHNNASSRTRFIDRSMIFVIQFGWTYITTTAIAVIVRFVKTLIW